jgi:hypothetical protein
LPLSKSDEFYLIAGNKDKYFKVVMLDALDLILSQEIVESILIGLEGEIDFIDIISCIEVDNIFIF